MRRIEAYLVLHAKGSGEIVKQLQTNRLDLSACGIIKHIGGDVIGKLAAYVQCVRLNVSDNALGDLGLQAIARELQMGGHMLNALQADTCDLTGTTLWESVATVKEVSVKGNWLDEVVVFSTLPAADCRVERIESNLSNAVVRSLRAKWENVEWNGVLGGDDGNATAKRCVSPSVSGSSVMCSHLFISYV
eukprot:GEMP01087810.1.p1 GENE.GEMP01087810.1~~GEMP01087810.1.p1  ORF type:complete len:190 (+),score=28.54 GEMP01087810.1:259-828(+)